MKTTSVIIVPVLLVLVAYQNVEARPDYGGYGSGRGGGYGGGHSGGGGSNGGGGNGGSFASQAFQGARDMYRAYSDMREANWRNSDRYFHARGNQDAASRGPGGEWAARMISTAREASDLARGGTIESSLSDMEANQWGRSGGDLNRYRPEGLPDQY